MEGESLEPDLDPSLELALPFNPLPLAPHPQWPCAF